METKSIFTLLHTKTKEDTRLTRIQTYRLFYHTTGLIAAGSGTRPIQEGWTVRISRFDGSMSEKMFHNKEEAYQYFNDQYALIEPYEIWRSQQNLENDENDWKTGQ